jgi:dihydrolipoamide dehydrogenase
VLKSSSKIFLVILIAGVLIAAYKFGVFDFITLENLKTQRDSITNYYETHRASVMVVFVSIYILMAALSIPGALILTLAAGAIFGLVAGTVLVSIGSTIGATLAFLTSRFLLRDAVKIRFRQILENVDRGIEREGAFYLLSLRLLPVFPFFMVNLLMGLTSIRVLTFFIVSQIGMFPATLAYVNAGTKLAQIESTRGILSADLILALVILGLLPFAAKLAISVIKQKRIYGNYQRPATYDYNMIVIGAGSAGLVSAYIAAAVKAKVLLIEKSKMGGDCLNTGCVPSKALIRSAKILNYFKQASRFGFDDVQPQFEFSRVMERVHRVIKQIEPHDSVKRYESLGVECLRGEATLLDPFRVQVNGKTFTAKNIILATGGEPLVPDLPGLSKVKYRTSENLWELETLPKRLVVLGGGPIGCELAQSFSRLGSRVTLVEMEARLLSKEDQDVAEHITREFQKGGIEVLLNHQAVSVEIIGDKKILNCTVGPVNRQIEFDEILVALGRRARTKGIGLEKLGIELSKNGTITVDEKLRTKFSNIYACGDVAGPFQFTHVAAHQAWYCAVNALFAPFKTYKADYRVIPWATFTDPEVARVGLNEQEAVAKKVEYQVSRFELEELDRAIADEVNHGFIKVLTEKRSDKILGVTYVGHHAGDLIAEFVVAMKHGIGLNKILGTIHIYPTLAEAVKYTAGQWKRQNAPARILKFLERFHQWRRKGVA